MLRHCVWVAGALCVLACESDKEGADTSRVVADELDASASSVASDGGAAPAVADTESSQAVPLPAGSVPAAADDAVSADDTGGSAGEPSVDSPTDPAPADDSSTETDDTGAPGGGTDGETPATSPTEEGSAPTSDDSAPCADCDAGPAPIRGHGDCAGKSCGQACNPCADETGDCYDDGLSICDAQGSCSSLTFVDCPRPIDGECSAAEAASDPSCAPTTFLDTADSCIQDGWIWNGCECTLTLHCGCAGGQCDRIYADYATCNSAYGECLPNACQAQDARSNGNMCGTVAGYAFTGYSCDIIMCGCTGEDCADVAATMQECQERWQVCMGRVPECADDRFPLVSEGDTPAPEYGEYTFAVRGYDPLYDPGAQSVTVFEDWTAAHWIGWGEDTATDPLQCPAVNGFGLWGCPYPRSLTVQVGEEDYLLDIALPWDFPLFGMVEPSDVEIKISAHASGTLLLQIRDQADGLPVLLIAQTLPDVSPQSVPWAFEPFTITPSGKFCDTDPDDCNTTFAALGVELTTRAEQWIVEPLSYEMLRAEGKAFGFYHGYLFEQFTGGLNCAAAHTPRQTFALVRTSNASSD